MLKICSIVKDTDKFFEGNIKKKQLNLLIFPMMINI